jgi:hypothetical protein
MQGKWIQRLTLGVAATALFAAAGGPSYAVNATTAALKKNSVTSSKIKKNAVTSSKIKDGAVTQSKISAAAQAALKGQKGDKGDTGATGTAAIRAHLDTSGTTDPIVTNASGVVSAEYAGSTGTYRVFANRDVDNCVVVGSLSASAGNTTAGEISLADSGVANAVYITTRDSAGAVANSEDFNVEILC